MCVVGGGGINDSSPGQKAEVACICLANVHTVINVLINTCTCTM